MKFLIVCIIVMSSITSGLTREKTYTSKSIFKHYKNAVVKIKIFQQGVHITTGTGFFINDKGDLATNMHVMRHALETSGSSAKFYTHTNKEIKNYKIGKCGDKRNIDLCVLRLEYKPKVWLSLDSSKPEIGEQVYIIGHPQNYSFSISKGLISGYRSVTSGGNVFDEENKGRIGEVQFSAPANPGNSGGPIISETGKLVGVVEWVHKGSQNLNFGITKEELKNFVKTIKSYKTAKAHMNENKKLVKVQVEKYKKKNLTPIWTYLKQVEKQKKYFSPTPKYFNPIAFKGFQASYTFDLFNAVVKECKQIINTKVKKMFHCPIDKTNGYYLTFQKAKQNYDVVKSFNKYLANPSPLPLLAGMMKRKDWKVEKKKYTQKQLKFLTQFQNKAYTCKSYGRDLTGAKQIKKECTTSIYNYGDFNATASRYQMQFGNLPELVTLTGYSNLAGQAPISIDAVALATLTARHIPHKAAGPSRSLASTSSKMTVADLMKKQNAKTEDLDALRYKCKIKGKVKHCHDLYEKIIKNKKNKNLTSTENMELDDISKMLCDMNKDKGYFCYMYGLRKRNTSYLIKSCKLGYKKACTARVPSAR